MSDLTDILSYIPCTHTNTENTEHKDKQLFDNGNHEVELLLAVDD